MIAHFVQWWIMGTTVSPIEPSETMYTLQRGAINAGVIFFSLAILATLIFGRFVCGWGCHILALQDFCAWLLKKAGLTPKAFRSRLLVYVPLYLIRGMGAGDVKLMAAVGAIAGPGHWLGIFLATAVIGGVVSLLVMAVATQMTVVAVGATRLTWTRAVVFAILILVLVFRPWGFLGQPPPERY